MIRVNLLPQEYRKAEATPLKQFFATMGAAVLAALAVVAWFYVHFTLLGPELETKRILEEQILTQEPKVARSKALAAKLSEYQSRYKKIDEYAQKRLVLSRKLDELWETLVNPIPASKYTVWIEGLTFSLRGGGKGKSKSGGSVGFGGTSAGAKMAKLVDFHQSIEESEFYRDFRYITPAYGGSLSELQGDDREPREGRIFRFDLKFKDLKTLYEDRDEREKAAAKEGE
ncbi:MAG: hypothetical protein ACYTDX_04655 [Planctomycetota bacterium]|jgi:Tfp pilus assembly protein PilN